MIDYGDLNALADKIYQSTNTYPNRKSSSYQSVYVTTNWSPFQPVYQNAYSDIWSGYSEGVLDRIIDPEVLYKLLRKEILDNNIISIYCKDLDESLYPEPKFSNNKNCDIIVRYSDACDRHIPIKIIFKDYSEDTYHIYNNMFDITKLYEDGITENDFVIAGSNIFLIKHISSISVNSIGSRNFCTVWFKDAVIDEKGNIVEEGYSRAFTLKEHILPGFRKSLENAGRYDLLLNL